MIEVESLTGSDLGFDEKEPKHNNTAQEANKTQLVRVKAFRDAGALPMDSLDGEGTTNKKTDYTNAPTTNEDNFVYSANSTPKNTKSLLPSDETSIREEKKHSDIVEKKNSDNCLCCLIA